MLQRNGLNEARKQGENEAWEIFFKAQETGEGQCNAKFFYRSIRFGKIPVYELTTWERKVKEFRQRYGKLKGSPSHSKKGKETAQEEREILPMELDHFLEGHKVPGTSNTFKVEHPNGKPRFLVEMTPTSKICSHLGHSQKSQLNKEILEGLKVQSAGNLDDRLDHLMSNSQVKEAAIRKLDIQLQYDATKTLELKTRGRFTYQQLSLLRQQGVKLSSHEDVRKEEEKLEFSFEVVEARLEVKKMESGEKYLGKEGKFEQKEDGTVLEDRLSIRAKNLKEVLTQMLEKNPPIHKHNIVRNYSTTKDDIRKKIVQLQEKENLIQKLQDLHQQVEEEMKKQIDNLIKVRLEETRKLREDLQEYQDDQEELCVLLIGDLGGGSFKLLLSQAGCVDPSSNTSSYVIAEMAAPDSYSNLNEVFAYYQVISSLFLTFPHFSSLFFFLFFF